MSQPTEEARAELARARLRFAVAVEDAKDQVRRHTGLRLGKRWALPLAAAAAGISAALVLRRRSKRGKLSDGGKRREQRPKPKPRRKR